MDVLEINHALLEELHEQACGSECLRMNKDLRTSSADGSQRMLNALQPGTKVPIHRHRETSETVICLHGRMEVVIYDVQTEYQEEKTSRTQDVLKGRTVRELSRHLLCPSEGHYGIQLPPGTWHSVEVYEPSTIFEAKDGAFAPAAVEDVVMV